MRLPNIPRLISEENIQALDRYVHDRVDDFIQESPELFAEKMNDMAIDHVAGICRTILRDALLQGIQIGLTSREYGQAVLYSHDAEHERDIVHAADCNSVSGRPDLIGDMLVNYPMQPIGEFNPDDVSADQEQLIAKAEEQARQAEEQQQHAFEHQVFGDILSRASRKAGEYRAVLVDGRKITFTGCQLTAQYGRLILHNVQLLDANGNSDGMFREMETVITQFRHVLVP